MAQQSPLWRQAVDRVERTIGPRADEFVRGETFAIASGLAGRARREMMRRTERSSRQVLHLLNLPAGSDVNRLLKQIASLERQIRDLEKRIDDLPRG
jgi:uncharacterized membrane protein YccC